VNVSLFAVGDRFPAKGLPVNKPRACENPESSVRILEARPGAGIPSPRSSDAQEFRTAAFAFWTNVMDFES
jgi:hypothetical protein